jgi:PhzF family phenazine biosynthesis protein
MPETLHRYTAFTTTPKGGNPAGVWIGDALPAVAEMQRIATQVGYSETAFVAPAEGFARTVRYYSPEKEFDFCGHATIASGVVLGQSCGAGEYRFSTNVGDVPVTVRQRNGQWEALLTSVTPRHEPVPVGFLGDALAALEWSESDLDLSIPAVRAYAGVWHLVIAARTPERLAALDYDFDLLKALMRAEGLATLQLIWRERPDLFHSRNPFPVGGVVEDPATGSGAAALGGYLRDAGLIKAPASIVILQGETMGRPSRLEVAIPVSGGIVVSGNAVPMES